MGYYIITNYSKTGTRAFMASPLARSAQNVAKRNGLPSINFVLLFKYSLCSYHPSISVVDRARKER